MSDIKVNFYESVPDERLKFAVIVSKYRGKWVWCKHRERDTYEIPGGHREVGEDIADTARRELYEETGAVDFSLFPVCVYAVEKDGEETCGMLFYAEIFNLEAELHSEIERTELFDGLPEKLTYPEIQPTLFEKLKTCKAMKVMNLLVIYSSDRKEILMCRRRKEPYKGLLNFTGGKVKDGESSIDAAYRELYEETSITDKDISLVHFMDMVYYTYGCKLEIFVGRLNKSVNVSGSENELLWVPSDGDFSDTKKFAGEWNIPHIIEMIRDDPSVLGL